MVEYAMLLTFIALACVVAVGELGWDVADVFDEVGEHLDGSGNQDQDGAPEAGDTGSEGDGGATVQRSRRARRRANR